MDVVKIFITNNVSAAMNASLGAVASCILVFLVGCAPKSEGNHAGTQYVDEASCRVCHQKEYELWLGSNHDLAMQEVSDQTVLADFNNTSFEHFGVTTQFYRDGNQFLVNTEGPDGLMADYQIKYVLGVEPLQQYLVEFPNGNLQCLTVAWDTKDNRWYSLYPDEKIGPDDPLHWTGLYQTWNHMCAACHTTDLRKNYNLNEDSYETEWSRGDVGCQACHGPGGRHVEWAKTDAAAAGETTSAPQNYGFLAEFKNDTERQAEACAPCHSRRQKIKEGGHHGKPLMDYFLPSLLSEGLYYTDGQILDEVYVYGSFVQSKMYNAGVQCTDCHEPHSSKLVKDGNELCIQCHQPIANERFSGLKLMDYDSPEHHFHALGSPGAQCVNCHAPSKIYMGVDPRRDHSFRIPRPDLSAKLGTPNACNQCHPNRTPQWAQKVAEKWYGRETSRRRHYGEAISAGRAAKVGADTLLIAVAMDKDEPMIARATAVQLLQNFTGQHVYAALFESAKDGDALVRTAAVGGMDRLPPDVRFSAASPYLDDPIRSVRIEAARVLSGVQPSVLHGEQKQMWLSALGEFRAAQKLMADQPAAHFNLGVMFENMGKVDSSESAYKMSIAKDKYFLPGRFNLVNLYNRLGRNQEANALLMEGLKLFPDNSQLYYSLGLLLAEQKKLNDAAQALKKAVTLAPEHARIRYNYALCLQHLERRKEAEMQLTKAAALAPADASIIHALAIFYVQSEKWHKAMVYADQLGGLLPGDQRVEQLITFVKDKSRK